MADELVGAVAVSDIFRAESALAVERLKRMGIRCMMITGDNGKVAAQVSKDLGLEEHFAEELPDQRAEKIVEIQSQRPIVGMIGDRANDSPAQAAADVGIAIGAGAAIAEDTAAWLCTRSNSLHQAMRPTANMWCRVSRHREVLSPLHGALWFRRCSSIGALEAVSSGTTRESL